MNVKFELTVEDYKKSLRNFRWNIPKFRHKYIFSVLQFPILIFGVTLFIRTFDTDHKPPFSYLVASSIILGIIIAAILDSYGIKKLIKKLHKDGGHFCEHTIEVNEEGVREITSINDTLYNWKGIKDVMDNEEYIYIITTSMASLAIPKRAFNSIEEANKFRNKATELLKENETCSNL
jgi:hypothetical protein